MSRFDSKNREIAQSAECTGLNLNVEETTRGNIKRKITRLNLTPLNTFLLSNFRFFLFSLSLSLFFNLVKRVRIKFF